MVEAGFSKVAFRLLRGGLGWNSEENFGGWSSRTTVLCLQKDDYGHLVLGTTFLGIWHHSLLHSHSKTH